MKWIVSALLISLAANAFAVDGLGVAEPTVGVLRISKATTSIFCNENQLTLATPEIFEISGERLSSVGIGYKQEGDCLKNQKLLNDYLKKINDVEISYKTRNYITTYYMDDESCNDTTCNVDSQLFDILEVEVQFLGYRLQNRSDKFIENREVEWPKGSCPPWSPDCDL